MTDINSQLQNYLSSNGSRSTASTGFSKQNVSLSGAGEKLSNWFSAIKGPSSGQQSPTASNGDDIGNAWFAQAQTDPLLPSLTKKQRVLGFIGCLLMGTFCFSLASLYIPLLLLKARKFALLYTMGSLFVIFSFSLLWGPVHHIKHLLSVERLPFSIAYFGTMGATLYFALSVQSTVFTIIFAVGQVLALIWYIISYIPGGQTGLTFFSKIFYMAASKTVQKTLPV